MSQNLKIKLLEGGTLMYNGTEYAPLEPVKHKPQKPKSNVLFALEELEENQGYWHITWYGGVEKNWWTGDKADIYLFNLNNIFLTKENAQKQADRNKLLAEIERFAVENNEEIDWNETETANWFLSFNNYKDEWQIDCGYGHTTPQITYFSSRELVTQALEKFKDRLDILLD